MVAHALLDVPITAHEQRQWRQDRVHLLDHQRTPGNTVFTGRFASLRGYRQLSNDRANSPEPALDQEERGLLGAPKEFNSPVILQQLAVEDEKPSDQTSPLPKLWTSIWLRNSTLCLFAVLFLCLVAALIVLWHFSKAHNGFAVSESTSHYAWTYGPTAVLVIIVSLWRQVDYHCKSLTPWLELSKGPVSASRSILVDHVSPFQITSFVAALELGHTSVVISVTGFALLKIITVFSTGLLVLVPTTITAESFPAVANSQYNASSFNQSLNRAFLEPSSKPVFARLGNVAYGLSYPAGVTPDFAYIPISLGDGGNQAPPIATYTVETDAFVPNAGCQIADVTVVNKTTNFTDGSSPDGISFNISASNVCQQILDGLIAADNPLLGQVPARQITGQMSAIDCLNDQGLQPDYGQRSKLLFTVADVRYSQSILPNGTIIGAERVVASLTNVICSPSYNITRVRVTNFTSSETSSLNISIVQAAQNRTFTTFSLINMTALYDQIWPYAEDIFGGGDFNSLSDTSDADTEFKLMVMEYGNGSESYEPLVIAANLRDAAASTFNSIMSYYAYDEFTSPTQRQTTASTTYIQNRLHIAPVSLWVMVGGFATMFWLSVLLLFFSPQKVTPRDPTFIATNAEVLSRSTDLDLLLQLQQARTGKDLRLITKDLEYKTTTTTIAEKSAGFGIMIIGEQKRGDVPESQAFKWWTPTTASPWFYGLTIITLMAILAILEVLQQSSNQHEGILQLQTDGHANQYIRFVPALALLLSATMVNALDFNVEALSPWSRLADGNTGARGSLMSNLLGRMSPLAMLEAVRYHYWGAVFSISAALVASIFTIIVSGLFTIESISTTGPTRDLLRGDNFQLQSYFNPKDDNGAATVVSMITYLNLSDPTNTYDELALPNFSLGDFKQSTKEGSEIIGPFTATVPTLRANLRCDIIPSKAISVSNLTTIEPDINANYCDYTIKWDYQLPSACSAMYASGNNTYVHWKNSFRYDRKGVRNYYGGASYDLSFGINSTNITYAGASRGLLSGGPADPRAVGDSAAVGCPSIAFTFSRFTEGSKATSDGVTGLICYQEIQQVQTNVTFEVNSTTLNKNYRPIVDESSVITQANPNSTNGATTFDFHIADIFTLERTSTTGLWGDPTGGQGRVTGIDVDLFFTWLINGTQNIDPDTLIGSANQDTLLSAMNHVYRRYMAQVYNTVLRDPRPTLKASNGDNSTTIVTNRRRQDSSTTLEVNTRISTSRLFQNETSKILLQVLLGLSAVLISAAYFLTPMRNILPINPCSIAGVMSLLAGSELCDGIDAGTRQQNSTTIVPGTEFMNERDSNRVFANGNKYSLGWWMVRPPISSASASDGEKKWRYGVDTGAKPDRDRKEIALRSLSLVRKHGEPDERLYMSGALGDPADSRKEARSASDQRGTYRRADIDLRDELV